MNDSIDIDVLLNAIQQLEKCLTIHGAILSTSQIPDSNERVHEIRSTVQKWQQCGIDKRLQLFGEHEPLSCIEFVVVQIARMRFDITPAKH